MKTLFWAFALRLKFTQWCTSMAVLACTGIFSMGATECDCIEFGKRSLRLHSVSFLSALQSLCEYYTHSMIECLSISMIESQTSQKLCSHCKSTLTSAQFYKTCASVDMQLPDSKFEKLNMDRAPAKKTVTKWLQLNVEKKAKPRVVTVWVAEGQGARAPAPEARPVMWGVRKPPGPVQIIKDAYQGYQNGRRSWGLRTEEAWTWRRRRTGRRPCSSQWHGSTLVTTGSSQLLTKGEKRPL